MGEIKKIVTEHSPAEKLPDELRSGIGKSQLVYVSVEPVAGVVTRRTRGSYIGAATALYATPSVSKREPSLRAQGSSR